MACEYHVVLDIDLERCNVVRCLNCDKVIFVKHENVNKIKDHLLKDVEKAMGESSLDGKMFYRETVEFYNKVKKIINESLRG